MKSTSTIALTLLSLFLPIAAQQSFAASKRGLAYHNPTRRGEYDIFFASNSTISWYYNWGSWPSSSVPTTSLPFYPLIHGIDGIEDAISSVNQIAKNRPAHPKLLTFNEPDGSKESGGSNISPTDAAAAYIRYILPLRDRFQISQPSTTGSGVGLNWLRAFNESCYKISPSIGCPCDFIATHHYGDFPALASWLGQLHEFYGGQKQIYITEFALPQASAEQNLRMMNTSLTYLDGLEYVAGYAWFGMFRTNQANNWTGPGVSLLDDEGGLTALGSLYLGGPERGFAIGAKSMASSEREVSLGGRLGMRVIDTVLMIAAAVSFWSLS